MPNAQVHAHASIKMKAATHPTAKPAKSNCTVMEEPAGPDATLAGNITSVWLEVATRSKLEEALRGEKEERVYCAVGKGALTSARAYVAVFRPRTAKKTAKTAMVLEN